MVRGATTSFFVKKNFQKNVSFGLHQKSDLCIIIARPPPRWTKWSRGVRTRGLRVGLVGGPRPLLFSAPLIRATHHSIRQLISVVDFQFKGHNIRTDNQPRAALSKDNGA